MVWPVKNITASESYAMTRQATVWEQAAFRRWPGCRAEGAGRYALLCCQNGKVAVVKLFDWPAARKASLKDKCDLFCVLEHSTEELQLPERKLDRWPGDMERD